MVVGTNRKQQIVEKASELFGCEGYDAISTKMLASACGVTEPALYRHFESKDEIYCAVLDSIEGKLAYKEVFESLEKEDDVEAVLVGLAHHILEFFTKNPGFYRLLLFSALREHDRAKKVHQIIRGTYARFLTDQLDRLYEQKLIVKKNNEITAHCFIGMVFDCGLGWTLWRGFQEKTFDPETVVANNAPIYARGLKVK
jgi:AcrR family transcriptional regulator